MEYLKRPLELERLAGIRVKNNAETACVAKLLDIVNGTVEYTFTLVDKLDLIATRDFEKEIVGVGTVGGSSPLGRLAIVNVSRKSFVNYEVTVGML